MGRTFDALRRAESIFQRKNTPKRWPSENAWNNKGVALYYLGRYEKAQRASKKASELDI